MGAWVRDREAEAVGAAVWPVSAAKKGGPELALMAGGCVCCRRGMRLRIVAEVLQRRRKDGGCEPRLSLEYQ